MNLDKTWETASLYHNIIIVYTMGMITNACVKLAIYKVKENINLNVMAVVLEMAGAICGILIMHAYASTEVQSIRTNLCQNYVQYEPGQKFKLDKLSSFVNSAKVDGALKFKYIMSVIIVQLCAISMMMLTRTKYLGECILMLMQMMAELKRFLLTFGIIIIMYLVFGRITMQSILVEMPSEPAKYWSMLLNLFTVINGKPDFNMFAVPFG